MKRKRAREIERENIRAIETKTEKEEIGNLEWKRKGNLERAWGNVNEKDNERRRRENEREERRYIKFKRNRANETESKSKRKRENGRSSAGRSRLQ